VDDDDDDNLVYCEKDGATYSANQYTKFSNGMYIDILQIRSYTTLK